MTFFVPFFMSSVVFKNFSMDFWVFLKVKNHQSSSLTCLQFFGNTLWLLCAGCITFSHSTSKLYWLYSVPLVNIYSGFMNHSCLPFSSPFLFTITVSVPFLLVLVPFLHFYQDGAFVLDFCIRFRSICSVFRVVFVLSFCVQLCLIFLLSCLRFRISI